MLPRAVAVDIPLSAVRKMIPGRSTSISGAQHERWRWRRGDEQRHAVSGLARTPHLPVQTVGRRPRGNDPGWPCAAWSQASVISRSGEEAWNQQGNRSSGDCAAARQASHRTEQRMQAPSPQLASRIPGLGGYPRRRGTAARRKGGRQFVQPWPSGLMRVTGCAPARPGGKGSGGVAPSRGVRRRIDTAGRARRTGRDRLGGEACGDVHCVALRAASRPSRSPQGRA